MLGCIKAKSISFGMTRAERVCLCTSVPLFQWFGSVWFGLVPWLRLWMRLMCAHTLAGSACMRNMHMVWLCMWYFFFFFFLCCLSFRLYTHAYKWWWWIFHIIYFVIVVVGFRRQVIFWMHATISSYGVCSLFFFIRSIVLYMRRLNDEIYIF